VDESQVSDTLLKLVAVTDRNGLKFPREFGLLVKQALYFDRYTRLLAPDVDVSRDERLEYLTTTTTTAK
jgi:aarF domain-containing kinase